MRGTRPASRPCTSLHSRFTALLQIHGSAARALLQAGAEVDPQDGYGDTPLWRAIFNSRGEDETVSILLAVGADPDICNASGVSPRALAERLGR
ncbi:ankyrin repeat domain-containing protein [Propionicimonas sp.]|uniref:ankyrin repeat domain-containing protein n=1 Tax=Propionicimonas sp. TaxID=1955623 RepID=UPI003D0EECDF